MRNHSTFLPLLGLALVACRTPAAEPAAVHTPQPATLPASAGILQPGPGGLLGGELVHDHRGAFGPLRLEQIEFSLGESRAFCRRLPAGAELEDQKLELEPAEVEALRVELDALQATAPKSVRRSALVHDLGVVTLTLRTAGQEQALVVDGATSLDPYPKALMDLVMKTKGRCSYAPATPAAD